MKLAKLLLNLCLCFSVFACQESLSSKGLRLWYKAPAASWQESLPLGNGRLVAMPDGGVFRENVVLNDLAMWPGNMDDSVERFNALRNLPEICKLREEGKNKEVQRLMSQHIVSGGTETPLLSSQLLGNLHLNYFFRDTDSVEFSGYERGLSLDKAVAWTRFKLGGTTYKREYFVSHANDLIVIKLTADEKEKLNFNVSMDRSECFSYYSNDDVLHMAGELENGRGEKNVRYLAQLKVVLENGTLLADSAEIYVNGATTAYILVSAGSGLQETGLEEMVASVMKEAEVKKYDELKKAHIDTYQEKFHRVELNLGQAKDAMPVDERLARFQSENEPALAALSFQFGRYLMICGDKESTLPFNLQGLWANSLFCVYPLCQIDNSSGGCIGIAGMLLQNQQGCLEVLPSIPGSWTSGNFKGLRADDSVSVDAEWKNGKLLTVCALAERDSICKLKIPAYAKSIKCNGQPVDISSGFSDVTLKKGDMAVWEIN